MYEQILGIYVISIVLQISSLSSQTYPLEPEARFPASFHPLRVVLIKLAI